MIQIIFFYIIEKKFLYQEKDIKLILIARSSPQFLSNSFGCVELERTRKQNGAGGMMPKQEVLKLTF